MARRGIETYLHAPCQPVVDMMPVVGSYIAGIDANVLDRIDQRKDLANLWPASHREQDLRARIDLRPSGERLAETGGLGDRECGANGPVVVRSPPNQGKDLSRSIAFDTRPAIEDALCNGLAEPKPVFLHAAAPHQRDMRKWRITGTCLDRFRRRKRSARCAFAQAGAGRARQAGAVQSLVHSSNTLRMHPMAYAEPIHISSTSESHLS